MWGLSRSVPEISPVCIFSWSSTRSPNRHAAKIRRGTQCDDIFRFCYSCLCFTSSLAFHFMGDKVSCEDFISPTLYYLLWTWNRHKSFVYHSLMHLSSIVFFCCYLTISLYLLANTLNEYTVLQFVFLFSGTWSCYSP